MSATVVRDRHDLTHADSIRDSDPERARARYHASRGCLDPDDPEDAERIRWLLDGLRGPDPDLLPLIRRAAAGPEGTELWIVANLRLAGHLPGPADTAEAASRLQAVLRAVWGRGDRIERAAAVNFAQQAARQGRELEALAAARRAERLMEEAGDLFGLAIARQGAAGALAEIEAWPEFEEMLSSCESVLPGLPAPARAALQGSLLALRADHAQHSGRFEEALRLVEKADGTPGPLGPAWGASIRAWIYARTGRHAECREEVEEVRRHGIGGWMGVATECADLLRLLGTGPDSEARDRAEAILARLGSDGPGDLGSGRRWRLAAEVAEALSAAAGFETFARWAHDLAVAGILDRVREIEDFSRRQPGAMAHRPEDAGLLRAYRARLLGRQAALCHGAGTLLREAKGLAGLPALDSRGPEEQLVICAWCTRLRTSDGTWLPVGQFFPNTGAITLTHSICPECLEAERARSVSARSL